MSSTHLEESGPWKVSADQVSVTVDVCSQQALRRGGWAHR